MPTFPEAAGIVPAPAHVRCLLRGRAGAVQARFPAAQKERRRPASPQQVPATGLLQSGPGRVQLLRNHMHGFQRTTFIFAAKTIKSWRRRGTPSLHPVLPKEKNKAR